jgi:hypothetical protein
MNNKRRVDRERILQHAAIFAAAAGILAAADFACLPLADDVKWLDVPIIIAGVTAIFSMIFYVDSVGYLRFINVARYLFLLSAFLLIVVVILYFALQCLWVKTVITFTSALICFILWLVL